ncbi:GAF domain-containing protein [Arthrobacter sp. zg-Y826]|uniref:helix-turn-helix domain-containing protein n=1 Tax=Arthrobacter jinronghuae TaxID=2964609 RepID=UPI0021052020|nr:GAF domain-containing protein [Arthrobacter jinronghuae]MCQ1955805.1 GAF domain-containing protein [Arthrobacter jinronghuae]
MSTESQSAAASGTRVVSAVLDMLDAGEQLSEAVIVEQLAAESASLEAATMRRLAGASARIARWRRRDRELSALISSARELSELRDAKSLLQRLVDRAHELIGTDLTYLSEYDPGTDELFVRATHGAVSADLIDLRVPAGIGLASSVVHTRAARWTADYTAEPDLPKSRDVDRAVGAEQMRSLLGVPMIAAGEVLGVLFAADRNVHHFSPEQVVLFSALADHAAVALQTARLFEEVRRSADAAHRAYAAAEDRAEAIARSAMVHEEMTQAVLAGLAAPEVAGILARSLQRSVSVVDRDVVPLGLAASVEAFDSRPFADAVRAAAARSRETGRCVSLGLPTYPDSYVVAAVAGKAFLGALVLGKGESPLTEVQLRTAERGAQTLALLTMQQDAVTDAAERVQDELVADLVSGRGHFADAVRRADSRGIDLRPERVVVAVPLPEGDRRRVLRHLLQTMPHWLAGQHHCGITVLVPSSDPGLAAEAVQESMRFTLTREILAVGAARAASPQNIAALAEEAWSCAGFLPDIGIVQGAVTVTAYAPYLAMFGPQAGKVGEFIEAAIGPLTAWDRERRSDLCTTLSVFMDESHSITRTAQALFVHSNTVKQRLERIESLLGDWRKPEPSFRIAVALRLHSLRTGSQRRDAT